jgi:hypothetical protein
MTFVWYFAYGSNMQSATLRGRRQIDYRRALPARVPGWRLVLDKPPLFGTGNSFANLIPDPAAEAFGVLFEITHGDLAHLDLTEGVLIDNYRRVAVTAHSLGDHAAPLQAFTLTSDRRDASLQPSTRYMNLLIEGAIEHGLPAEYVAYLRTIPAIEEHEAIARFRPMIDEFLRKPPSDGSSD